MKFITIIISAIIFIFNAEKVFMSESYFWYTIKNYAILQEENKTFFVYKIIDINGISEVSTENTELNYNFKGKVSVEYVLEDEIILSDDKNYYSVSKNKYALEDNGVIKLMPKSEIVKIVDGIFFYKLGNVKLADNAYSKTANYKTLKNIPYDFEILDKYRWKYILKTKDKILFYNLFKDEAKYIDIDAKTAVYKKNEDGYSFLYDDKRFYIIESFDIAEELTEDFAIFNKKAGFLEWEYFNLDYNVVFEEKRNNALWVYIEPGISLQNNRSVYFYPIEAKYISKDNTVIEHKGKYYTSGYNAIYEKTADISEVKDISSLEKFGVFYKDNYKVYNLNSRMYFPNKFVTVKNVSVNAVFYPSIESFMYSTGSFIDDDGVIKFYSISDKEGVIYNSIPHNTYLKFLRVAYAFDDKLLIENEIIKSPMDFESISFVESYVDVIRGYSDKGLAPLAVKYRHYFKDKNGTYMYESRSKELKKVE